MTLEPGGILAWLIVGLIAGWLAGQVMKGGGYGLIGDIVMGIIGAFIGGFVLQFAGGLLLLLDWHRGVGAALLIAFTVLASAVFHRWWLIHDPLLSHLHLSNLIVNCGVVGGLLLVAAI